MLSTQSITSAPPGGSPLYIPRVSDSSHEKKVSYESAGLLNSLPNTVRNSSIVLSSGIKQNVERIMVDQATTVYNISVYTCLNISCVRVRMRMKTLLE